MPPRRPWPRASPPTDAPPMRAGLRGRSSCWARVEPARLCRGAYRRARSRACAAASATPRLAACARLRRDARPDWPAQALVALTTCLDDGLSVKDRPACRRSPLAASAADFAAACGLRAALDAAGPLAAPAVEVPARAPGRARPAGGVRGLRPAARPRPARVALGPRSSPAASGTGADSRARRRPANGAPAFSADPGQLAGLPVRRRRARHTGTKSATPCATTAARATSAPDGFDASYCDDSWPQCAREHLAQGLALRREPKRRANPRLPFQARVAARFAEYEKNRARYPDVTAFLPRMRDALGARPAPAVAAVAPEPAA